MDKLLAPAHPYGTIQVTAGDGVDVLDEGAHRSRQEVYGDGRERGDEEEPDEQGSYMPGEHTRDLLLDGLCVVGHLDNNARV